jgi:hypothetical protein
MLIDIEGQQFGRWTALRFVGRRGPHQMWRCRCQCGETRDVAGAHLRRGGSQSCGCLRRERTSAATRIHGASGTPEHQKWISMLRRCTDSTAADYARYGGRGISVCNRWRYGEGALSAFSCFLADMGKKPYTRATLERINNDGNYEPGNVTWADRRAQSRNRSNNVEVKLGHKVVLLADALRALDLSKSSYYYLKRLGYSPQGAIDRLAGKYNGPPR